MMTTHTITIAMTPAQFAACCAAAQKDGVALAGTSGEIKYHGVTAAYEYDGAAVLTITIEHKPFIEPESALEKRLRVWLAAEEKSE